VPPHPASQWRWGLADLLPQAAWTPTVGLLIFASRGTGVTGDNQTLICWVFFFILSMSVVLISSSERHVSDFLHTVTYRLIMTA
jgi:hypothetical protein